MTIVPLTNDYLGAWNEFVEDHPHSSLYHHSGWMELLCSVFGYKQRGFLMLDGKQIAGGLPLYEVKGFRGKRLISNPFRDRGGLLVKEGVSPQPLLEKAVDLMHKERFLFLLIKEEHCDILHLLKSWPYEESTVWVTTLVDLTAGKGDLWDKLNNNASGPVKQARNFGLKIRNGNSFKDIEAFYGIFLRSQKRLGIPAFPLAFFTTLWNSWFSLGKANLLLALKDDLPVAGVILLMHKKTVFDGYSASLPEHKSLRANDLLIWESLAWACDAGYQTFDFGADSCGQEGLLAFKRKWRGTHRNMRHYFVLNKSRKIDNMDSSEPKYQFIRRAMSRLPLGLYARVSEKTIPYLG